MKIKVEYRDDKFVVDAPFEALEIMRGAPIRRWDKKTDRWILPAVSRIRDYLRGYGAEFIGDAAGAPERRRLHTAYDGAGHTFKTKPYTHQLNAVGASADRRAFGYLCDPGTGKSKMIVDDLAYQQARGRINAAVIVCPNSITGNWEDELDTHMSCDFSTHVWAAGGTKKLTAWTAGASRFPVLVVAVESLSTKPAADAVAGFLAKFNAAMVIDESSRIKTHDAARTKHITKLGRLAKLRRIATGTPATKGPHQLWSQVEFLDPAILDMDFYPFRAFFCTMGGYQLKQVIAPKNQDILLEIMAPYMFVAAKSECLDLPAKVFQRREWDMSPEQLKLYGEIMAEATMPLVRDLRLHQLLGGFQVREEAKATIRDLDPTALLDFLENGEMVKVMEPIPGPNPHLAALLEELEEIDGKVVIWCRYRAEIEIIAQALRPLGGVVEFHGGVSIEDRNAGRRGFQADPAIRFFVGQINTGGIGITLTAASEEIFYSNDWSGENRIQAEDRIHRIGQEGQHCRYTDLVARGNWIDKRVLQAVQNGKDYHAEVMGDLGHLTGGAYGGMLRVPKGER